MFHFLRVSMRSTSLEPGRNGVSKSLEIYRGACGARSPIASSLPLFRSVFLLSWTFALSGCFPSWGLNANREVSLGTTRDRSVGTRGAASCRWGHPSNLASKHYIFYFTRLFDAGCLEKA